MKPKHPFLFTPAYTEVLIELYPHIPTDWFAKAWGVSTADIYRRASQLGLHKTELAGRLNSKNCSIGAAGRFTKGITPWNKGKSHPARGRSAQTQFKPGVRQGVATKLYKPIGTERISKDGYLERKINDDMPPQKRWRAVHLIEWEAANGPLPKGHAIAFKDGNKENRALDNLELITRAELMKRNTIHNLPPALKEVITVRRSLTRAINRMEKDHVEQNH